MTQGSPVRRAASVIAALLVAGCTPGGDRTAPPPPDAPLAVTGQPAPGHAPQDLEGVVWHLIEVREDGVARDVGELDHVLRFDGEGRVGGHGCNWFGSSVVTTTTEVEATGFSSTQMGCGGIEGRLDALTRRTLEAGARWDLAEGWLTLAGNDIALLYKERDTAFRTRGVTPLVQDADGDQVHRLGWQAVGGQVSVEWEARDEPGFHSDLQGFRLPPDHVVTGLIPHNGQSTGRGFVFVATRSEHSRVVFLPREGGPAVPLQSYDIPAAATWRLFAGFVGAARDRGWIAAYDSRGREVMRSYEITV